MNFSSVLLFASSSAPHTPLTSPQLSNPTILHEHTLTESTTLTKRTSFVFRLVSFSESACLLLAFLLELLNQLLTALPLPSLTLPSWSNLPPALPTDLGLHNRKPKRKISKMADHEHTGRAKRAAASVNVLVAIRL